MVFNVSNIYNNGAYISGDKIFWSYRPAKPYKEDIYNGIKCIKYPVKMHINEKLKIRKSFH